MTLKHVSFSHELASFEFTKSQSVLVQPPPAEAMLRRQEPLRKPAGFAVTLRSTGFRGNKAALPSKPCVACGLPMSWRRNWAKNWADVKYCSNACRRKKAAHG